MTRLGGDELTRRDTDASINLATTWRASSYLQGYSQGHLAVVFNQHTVDATILRGFSVPGGGAHDNHLVYIRLDEKSGTGRWVVASCHTPYLSATAANQYNRRAMAEVIQKRHFGTPENQPDIWMGDFNAYAMSLFTRREAGEYEELPFGPTSGFGGSGGVSHSRLDRIVHKKTSPVAGYGRVIPSDLTPRPGDIVESIWTSPSVPSDHLPIYVDRSLVPAAAAPAPLPTSGVKRSGASDPMPPDPPRVKRGRKLPPPGGS